MPKVGSSYYTHRNHSFGFSFDVHFGNPYGKHRIKNSEKVFYIKLPEDIGLHHGKDYVTGSDIDRTEATLKEVADAYYNAKQKKKRVIGYKLDTINHHSFKAQFPEIGFSLQYSIGWITEIGDKKFFSLVETGKLMSLDGHWHNYGSFVFIDYTKEAEEWFAKTYATLQRMIEGCEKFFGQTQDKFLKSITSSNLLEYKPEKK